MSLDGTLPPRRIVVGESRDQWMGRSVTVILHHNDFQSSAWDMTPDEARDLAERLLAHVEADA